MSLPAPKFYTKRLVYRAATSDDRTGVFVDMQEPGTMLHGTIGRIRPRAPCSEDSLKRMDESLAHFIVCLWKEGTGLEPGTVPEPGLAIGHVMLDRVDDRNYQHRLSMFGISLSPGYQGKGYGTEALAWLFDQGFYRYGLHRIECGTPDFNEAGLKLYKKIGMTEEGRRRKCHWAEGKFRDQIQFGILDDEWSTNRGTLTDEPAPGS